jgi:hypothetical protein
VGYLALVAAAVDTAAVAVALARSVAVVSFGSPPRSWTAQSRHMGRNLKDRYLVSE